MTVPLEVTLRDAGVPCCVEVRDRLVILVHDPALARFGRDQRLLALQLARAAGFTHVALELARSSAPLPRA